MANSRAKSLRQVVVWLHVISSVCWMGQALALSALLSASVAADGTADRAAAASAAVLLDGSVLVMSANASAFTGFLLAAATPWGYLHHWWVAAKFALTLGQLYAGIFVLSDALHRTEIAAAQGVAPHLGMVVGSLLMASGLAFQAWLSVAKPWGRTPWAAGHVKPATAPSWVFATATGAVLADSALALTWQPMPVCSLVVLWTALIVRRRRAAGSRSRSPGGPTTSQASRPGRQPRDGGAETTRGAPAGSGNLPRGGFA